MTDEQMADVTRALAHPARLRIAKLLAAQAECRGVDVFAELPLAQSTISEHLRILKEAGVISARPIGTSSVYCLDRPALEALACEIAAIAATAPSCAGTKGC